jgi:hypothetical protein
MPTERRTVMIEELDRTKLGQTFAQTLDSDLLQEESLETDNDHDNHDHDTNPPD